MTDINEAKKMLLAEWEKKRDEYNVLIAALRRELGMSLDAAIDSGSPANLQGAQIPGGDIDVNALVRPGDFFGMTQVAAVEAFFQRTGRRAATLQEIAQALNRGKATEGLLDEKGMRNLSSLMSRSDQLMSVAKGRWGLAEWYPGKKKQKRQKASGEEQTQKEAAQ